ncbi:MAG: methyltransferase domain-containing protein [Solirubrobacteraceae bacterium]|nr:methyltransferase domain-containing protein [Solirubrobacteraceae bacterium]
MMVPAHTLYAEALRRGDDLVARDAEGDARRLAISDWVGAAGEVDERVLDRARGPVLDIGCGPGRHVRALRRRGVEVLGIDISPVAVRIAQRRGAQPVLRGDVFAPLPRAGWWQTALLLDGNLGIGGDPVALLSRLQVLLGRGGRVLCETDAHGTGVRVDPLRLEDVGRRSGWFAWARVGADAIDDVASSAGLAVTDRWQDADRAFAELR